MLFLIMFLVVVVVCTIAGVVCCCCCYHDAHDDGCCSCPDWSHNSPSQEIVVLPGASIQGVVGVALPMVAPSAPPLPQTYSNEPAQQMQGRSSLWGSGAEGVMEGGLLIPLGTPSRVGVHPSQPSHLGSHLVAHPAILHGNVSPE
jgi:hypothetical protein